MSHRDFTAELAALQHAGAATRDPIGFEHLRLMVQRLAGQPEAVQQVMAERVEAGLVRAQMRLQAQAQAQIQAQDQAQKKPPPSKPQPGPLAALPSHAAWRHGDMATLSAATAAWRPGTGTGTGTTARAPATSVPRRELHSVDRFRESWAQVAAEAQVKQALGRAPDNAGPLNSHVLVLRALEALQALSPEHLRAMLTQFDALLWLEQATQKPTLKPAPKSAPKPSSKPAAKPSARTRKGTSP